MCFLFLIFISIACCHHIYNSLKLTGYVFSYEKQIVILLNVFAWELGKTRQFG